MTDSTFPDTNPSLIHLESKRFAPSKEAIDNLKLLRDFYDQESKQDPQLSGISFFGSQLTGLATKDSDYDTVLFYDGSKYDPSDSTDSNSQAISRREYTNALKSKLSNFMNAHGMSVGNPIESTILAINISEQETRRLIALFITWCKIKREDSEPPINFVNLASRFYLGIGAGLMKNRALILDEVAKLPEGEKYLEEFVRTINYFERRAGRNKHPEIPDYHHLPKDIAEVRKKYLGKS